MQVALVILIAIVAAIVCPLILICALNTLVPTLAIQYTGINWLAALFILILLRGGK